MDGMYPDDLNKRSGPAPPQAPASHFAPNRPPEDEDLYLPPSQRPKPKWRKAVRRTLGIILSVVVIAALAGGVYLKFLHNKKPAPTTNKPAQTVQTPGAFTTQTKSYTSTNAGLGLTYPKTWTVSDNTDALTITSPIARLHDVSGGQFQGKVILTVQPKGSTPKAFDVGGAISVIDSQKITYAKPTSVQRGQTYLSFLQYTQEFVQNQLDGVYVTGDFGYQAKQFVPKTDIAKLDPLITVTFAKCTDTNCANPAPASIAADAWTNKAGFQATILNILKSIQVSD